MDAESIKKRVKAVRARFDGKRIDALILTRPVDVSYLTGFSGEDSWVVVTRSSAYLLTDSRYTEQAQKECVRTTIVERTGSIVEAAGRLLGRLKSVESAGVEKSVSLATYQALKKQLDMPLKGIDSPTAPARARKDDGEVAAIRSAVAIATAALEEVLGRIEPGVSESELAGILDLEVRKRGAGNSFDTIVAFGANGSRPHHQPTGRRLKWRDAVLIDFGARYNGYCSDITRSFALGKPTPAYRQAWEVTEKAQMAAIATARPGVKLTEVDAAARNVIRESGLPVYGHGTGHGLGLEIHETPFLKEGAKGKLEPGQVITIEPGVYIPGKLGIRIEDDVLITHTGCEILTRECPHRRMLG